MTINYVKPDGTYVGGYSEATETIPEAKPSDSDAAPYKVEELICIGQEHPEYADQIWLFPGWTESRWAKVRAETAWRTYEMALIQDQLLRLEDSDPTALPGTELEWREHRIKVRAWIEGAEGFPEKEKRPVQPHIKK